MEKIQIMTDSACDISEENEKRYGIRIVSFQLAAGGKSYTSRIDFDHAAFYRLLEESDDIPSTSQITPFEFGELFEDAYQAGYTHVIYVSINSAGSATYSNAVLAAGNFFENHPEAVEQFFLCNIDSGLYTGCYGYGVVEAAKLRERGADARKIEAFLRDWCDHAVSDYQNIFHMKPLSARPKPCR